MKKNMNKILHQISILKKYNIKYNNYAEKYGSIIATISNSKYEFTSLREDYNQKGRSTNVIFTRDWKKDAARRDFTINAIYLSSNGQVYDYFNGIDDLLNKKVRFIGDINIRIQEDYLRIFRFFRFLGCFNEIKIIQGYEDVLRNNIPNIFNYVNQNIMRVEIIKMLKNPYAINSFRDFTNPFQKNDLIKMIYDLRNKKKIDSSFLKCIDEIEKLFLK